MAKKETRPDDSAPQATQNNLPEKCCVKCNFYEKDPNNMNQGVCKRFPPSHMLLPTQQGLVPMAAFPPVQNVASCGEYKTKFIN